MIVDRDLHVVTGLATRLLVLREGRVVAEGDVDTLRNSGVLAAESS